MKYLSFLYIFLFLMDTSLKAQILKTEDDSLAYSLGVMIAGNMKREGFGDLNPDMVMAGMKQVLNGEQLLFPVDECNGIVQAGSARKKNALHEANKVAGEEFLAKNKTKSGVTSLASGVQYEVLKEGNGAKPTLTDSVKVHYHGTLINGTIFDSSVDRGKPITFAVTQVIKGWTEILQQMPVGSKWRVYIPYQMAYGDRAAGAKIPPYSTLIFEMELLAIE